MALALVALGALPACVGTAVAQGTGAAPVAMPRPSEVRPEGIAELRARLERLEKQNEEFKRRLEGRAGSEPPPPAEPTKADGRNDAAEESRPALKAEWRNGLQIMSRDEAFRIHVGGNVQFDAGWNAASEAVEFGPGGIGELQDGATFRRASLRVDGTLYENISWLVEYDFANTIINDTESGPVPIGTTGFTEVSVTISSLPCVGNLRAGWMGEPLGLSALTSSRWLNFMERAPGINSFFATSPGAMLFNWTEDERLTWAVGLFHPSNNSFGFGVGNGELAGTGRVTWLPWYEDEGRELVHLGVGASQRKPADGMIQLRGRPSVRTEPGSLLSALADTGDIATGSITFLGAELAGVYGPWTLQSEYYGMFLHDAAPVGASPVAGAQRHTLFCQGAYVEVLYFLTGEYRAYSRRDGTFDRVVPRQNFRIAPGSWPWGAWQVGVRYAYLDLQTGGCPGPRSTT